MLENDEEIILDDANNVFVGPNEYFQIVLEDFDGETINEWYVEDAQGNRTQNLAERAEGKHIDLLLGTGNRTVKHFYDRIIGDVVQELREKVEELETNAQ